MIWLHKCKILSQILLDYRTISVDDVLHLLVGKTGVQRKCDFASVVRVGVRVVLDIEAHRFVRRVHREWLVVHVAGYACLSHFDDDFSTLFVAHVR